jgi:hypothetical protein
MVWLAKVFIAQISTRKRPCVGITDDTRVLLGKEGHSDSDLFVIFLDDRLQEGKEVLSLLRVFLSGYVAAELLHEFHIVHTNAIPPPARDNCDSPMEGSWSGIQESLYRLLYELPCYTVTVRSTVA